MRNKKITVKKHGRPFTEFFVSKKELKLADKLGVPTHAYILAKTQMLAAEKLETLAEEETKHLLNGEPNG